MSNNNNVNSNEGKIKVAAKEGKGDPAITPEGIKPKAAQNIEMPDNMDTNLSHQKIEADMITIPKKQYEALQRENDLALQMLVKSINALENLQDECATFENNIRARKLELKMMFRQATQQDNT